MTHKSTLISVNVGRPRLVMLNGRPHSTAIFKTPVQGRVMARTINLDGDRQADRRVHGGEHKAVYAYPEAHYATWAEQLDRDDLTPGAFGENFTVTVLNETTVHIGDRFRVGGALLEVTQPRVPCANLAIRMKDPTFPKRFLESGRSGFYLRVLEEGEVGAGDAFERVVTGPLSVRELYRLRFFDKSNAGALQAAMEIPALSAEWRRELRELLEKAG